MQQDNIRDSWQYYLFSNLANFFGNLAILSINIKSNLAIISINIKSNLAILSVNVTWPYCLYLQPGKIIYFGNLVILFIFVSWQYYLFG